MGESHKRIYKPKFPHKYSGNSNVIMNRSSWETIFAKWCDENRNVIEWSSEEIVIPYVSPLDNKIHRYFPDFKITVKEQPSGILKTYLVEIKPRRQTQKPVHPGRTTKKYLHESKTYAVNLKKWEAAKKYADRKGWEFVIRTEYDLGLQYDK